MPVNNDEAELRPIYLSLCRGLVGHYVLFHAKDQEVVRRHATRYFGQIWCDVYSEAYFLNILRKRYPGDRTKVVNPKKPIVLTSDDGAWE